MLYYKKSALWVRVYVRRFSEDIGLGIDLESYAPDN